MTDTSPEARLARAADERRRYRVPNDAPVVRVALYQVRSIEGRRRVDLLSSDADGLYRCATCSDGPAACLARRRAVVRDYVRVLTRGGSLPPILVRRAGAGFDVLDGAHRLSAYQAAGKAKIPAIIVL